MRFAICQEAFKGWDWPTICRFVKEAGYDGVELAPFMFAKDVRDIPAEARKGIKDTAESWDLAVTGLHWLLLSPPGLALSSPDKAVRDRTRDYLKALADFCRDVGGGIMTLGSPKQRSVPEGYDRREVVSWLVDILRDAGNHAYSAGVTLCLEALPARDTNLMTTAAETLEMAKAVGSPGVSMMLDVKSMCSEAPARTIPDIIGGCAGNFLHFHANDANLRAPGYGEVDFVPILKALNDAGYDGWVSVEAFDFHPDPRTMAIETLGYLKGCLGRV